jgi:hypothetical protein
MASTTKSKKTICAQSNIQSPEKVCAQPYIQSPKSLPQSPESFIGLTTKMRTSCKYKKTICAEPNIQSPESLAESPESLTQMTSYFPTSNDSELFDFVTEMGNIPKSPKTLQRKAITTPLTNNSCAQP